MLFTLQYLGGLPTGSRADVKIIYILAAVPLRSLSGAASCKTPARSGWRRFQFLLTRSIAAGHRFFAARAAIAAQTSSRCRSHQRHEQHNRSNSQSFHHFLQFDLKASPTPVKPAEAATRGQEPGQVRGRQARARKSRQDFRPAPKSGSKQELRRLAPALCN